MESALVEHEAVAEAAVVGHPHPVKGECLYCFVTLCDGHIFSPTLTEELKKQSKELPGAGAEGSASYWGEATANCKQTPRVPVGDWCLPLVFTSLTLG